MRRIWKLPYSCHTAIVDGSSGQISLFDFMCNRFLDFANNGLKSDNILLNFVVKYGVFFGCMCSAVGRNVQFC